ncbi:MAG: dihydrodipicolinate synthase family protein [Christensenellales bacterium]
MQKELYPLRGLVTTVITPFKENGKVDYPSLQREITAACSAGAAGFLVPCIASEIPLLTFEEKRDMVMATAEIVRGKAAIITSITAPTTDQRLKLMEQYLKFGVNGININLSCETPSQYISDIAAIDNENPPFLILQDVDFNGPGIPDKVLIECFERFKSVIGVKVEVHNAGVKYTRLQKATGGRMHISSGWGNDQMIEVLDRGVHVVMPSGLFEIFTKIYSLHTGGRREAAKDLFYDILPVIAFTRQDGTINRAFHKRYFKEIGLFDTCLSREEVVFDEIHESYAKELIQRAIKIRSTLGKYE